MRRVARGVARFALAACGALALACGSVVTAQELTASQREEVLREAQRDYDRGIELLRSDPTEARRLFQESAGRFRLLLDVGSENGWLHFNLANAHLQAGQLGRAILHYRRAEPFIPGDPRLASNLEYARSLCRSRIEPSGGEALVGALLTWHRRTPLPRRAALFAVLHAVFWLALLGGRLRPAPWWRFVALPALVIALALGASIAADLMGWGRQPAGVVLVDDLVVRKGNGEGFEPQFDQPLHQGVEFRLIERRGDWLHIELRDGKTGWIRTGAAGMV